MIYDDPIGGDLTRPEVLPNTPSSNMTFASGTAEALNNDMANASQELLLLLRREFHLLRTSNLQNPVCNPTQHLRISPFLMKAHCLRMHLMVTWNSHSAVNVQGLPISFTNPKKEFAELRKEN